ncbi:hypothetical protein WJX73_008407 [Symbiochloris irregularis]|uniref:Amino acid transporter n=1 Tax=Symbiochloris irregularis TaxID=706552 RepID=A0AAW1NX33_9CHLO
MTDTTLEWGLKLLGLKQEFKREFNVQASFGLSFVIMSPFVGLSGGLTYAWFVGGPGPASWGWAITSVLTLCTGLSLAEILSGLPVSGGPYCWTALLGGRHGALLSWITGWANYFGLTALTASAALATMYNVAAVVQILTGVTVSPYQQLLILQGILVIGGAVNSSSPILLTRCMFYGTFINVAGVIFVVLLLPTVSPWRQSPQFVFATFFDKSISPFIVPSNAYIWIQGVCLALFTMAGFDSCSHLSEEMKGANSSAPKAMIWSIMASSTVGFALLVGVLFCVQSSDALFYSSATNGFALGQLVFDVFNARFGTGVWSVSVLFICILAGCMTTIACITSTSRMLFSFARSKALPFSPFFSYMSQNHHMPIRTVWLSVTGPCIASILLFAPNPFLFGTMVSYGFAGQQLAHGLPIFCRLTISRHTFEPGPIHLGKWSRTVGWISVAWIGVSMAILSFPASMPVTFEEVQLPLCLVLGGSLISWYLPKYGAKNWFIDPKQQAASAMQTPLLNHWQSA